MNSTDKVKLGSFSKLDIFSSHVILEEIDHVTIVNGIFGRYEDIVLKVKDWGVELVFFTRDKRTVRKQFFMFCHWIVIFIPFPTFNTIGAKHTLNVVATSTDKSSKSKVRWLYESHTPSTFSALGIK